MYYALSEYDWRRTGHLDSKFDLLKNINFTSMKNIINFDKMVSLRNY